MKSKKLLVSLAIIAVVVVIIVVMASVFSVRQVYIRYHAFNGELTSADAGEGVPASVLEKIAKGKSTVFLSKTNFLAQVNEELRANYKDWHAFAVVKSFPNILEVHLVKRTAIAKLTTTAEIIYIDSFGYQVSEPDYDCIDITSAFNETDRASTSSQDGVFRFASEESNTRLNYVIEAILATWQCYVEIDEMDSVLLPNDAFKFDETDGSMMISLRPGGVIRLLSPETNLSSRLQKAYGVYYNSKYNLQSGDWVITVYKNGRITTPDPNKK